MRDGLERAVERAPGQADGWAMLAICTTGVHTRLQAAAGPTGQGAHGRTPRSRGGPSNHFAHYALAEALFFLRERQLPERRTARNRAEPMDGNSIAYMGMLMAFAGEWEKGCALAARAKQLNPSHPGWHWIATLRRVPPARLSRRA